MRKTAATARTLLRQSYMRCSAECAVRPYACVSDSNRPDVTLFTARSTFPVREYNNTDLLLHFITIVFSYL